MKLVSRKICYRGRLLLASRLNLHLLKLRGRTTATLTCADKATRCAISGWARTLCCSVEVPADEDLLLPEQRERVQL